MNIIKKLIALVALLAGAAAYATTPPPNCTANQCNASGWSCQGTDFCVPTSQLDSTSQLDENGNCVACGWDGSPPIWINPESQNAAFYASAFDSGTSDWATAVAAASDAGMLGTATNAIAQLIDAADFSDGVIAILAIAGLLAAFYAIYRGTVEVVSYLVGYANAGAKNREAARGLAEAFKKSREG